jgi:general secretion pathway protein J
MRRRQLRGDYSPRGKRLASTGFTLLELLISITLLGFILVLLFGGLRLGIRSWDAVQQRVDNLNAVRSVEGFLRRELESVVPYRWKGGTGSGIAFLGERNKVSFVAHLPERIGVGGLYVVSLELQQSSRGRRLIWRQAPIANQATDFSALDQVGEMVLAEAELNSVDDIWLTYFGPDGDSRSSLWTDHWESTSQLPFLIRIQVKFSSGGEWPEFVVAPRLNSEIAR